MTSAHQNILLLFSMASRVLAQAPTDIAWGFATSAYQIEGGWDADGKGPSVWDKWYNDPSRLGRPNAFVANEHYHRMKPDIGYLGQLNATAYRFSVSWPRIFPNCNDATPNAAGIKFYSDMIDEIIRNGAEPVLTLFHWDTPQACHDQYQSWLSPRIVDDFTKFADVIFNNYGSRLKYILTINEPHAFCGWGYEQQFWPPGVNAGKRALYDCLGNVVLAHASVAKLAKNKYPQHGLKFGMPLIISYGVPFSDSQADRDLSSKHNAHQTDIYWGPLIEGDYPAYTRGVRDNWISGDYLVTFTDAQKELLKGTLDYLAVNYYSANYVSTTVRDFPSLGPTSGTSWQTMYPPGIRGLSKWAYDYYKMEVMITECGTSVPNEMSMTLDQVVADTFREDFFRGIVTHLTAAVVEDKVPITAFLAWALFDNFEWNTYDQVFGLVAIDRQNGTLARNVKNSARFLSGYFSKSKSPFIRKFTPPGPTKIIDDLPPRTTANPSNNADLVSTAVSTSWISVILAWFAL